jgi:hypothetical protein
MVVTHDCKRMIKESIQGVKEASSRGQVRYNSHHVIICT